MPPRDPVEISPLWHCRGTGARRLPSDQQKVGTQNVCGKARWTREAREKNWDSAQAAYENIMIIFDYIRLRRTLRIHDYDYTVEAQSSAIDYNRELPWFCVTRATLFFEAGVTLFDRVVEPSLTRPHEERRRWERLQTGLILKMQGRRPWRVLDMLGQQSSRGRFQSAAVRGRQRAEAVPPNGQQSGGAPLSRLDLMSHSRLL